MHLFKRDAVMLALLILALCATWMLSLVFPKPRLNLIVISLDSVRADHLQSYGYARNTMPHTEAWANGGFIFSKYFATSYLTPISEVSVQTGDTPFTTGLINFAAVADPTVPFLAETLKQNGYQTAAFGSSPEYEINDGLKQSFSRGFDIYAPYATSSVTILPGQKNVTLRTSSGFMDDALAWLSSGRDEAKPFYLWLPIGSAHMPYFGGKPLHFADPSYQGPLKNISYDEFPTLYGYLYNGNRYDTNTMRHSPVIGPLTKEDLQFINDRYDDGLYFSDEILQKLFEYLQTSGLEWNTIVVFESEHGETLGERGYIAHYDVYDETLHTPLVMHVPGMRGRRIDSLISSTDILPTVLSALTVTTPAVEGKNFLPLLNGETNASPRSDILITRTPLWERVSGLLPSFNALDDTQHFYDTAIRSDTWKLIHRLSRQVQYTYGWWGMLTGNPTLPPAYELYDITIDPGETRNIYDAHKNDADVVGLMNKLMDYEASIDTHTIGPTHTNVQPYF